MRRVLELRRPGPVALVYVEVSWYYHQWLKLIEGDVLAAELYKTEYAGVGAWGHYNMLAYYGVPQVSAMDFAQLTWEHPNRTDLAVEFKDRPGVFQTDVRFGGFWHVLGPQSNAGWLRPLPPVARFGSLG